MKYDNHKNYPVKILISIRSDLLHFLYEIQEALGNVILPLFKIGLQHKKIHTYGQATAIFMRFIAETETRSKLQRRFY